MAQNDANYPKTGLNSSFARAKRGAYRPKSSKQINHSQKSSNAGDYQPQMSLSELAGMAANTGLLNIKRKPKLVQPSVECRRGNYFGLEKANKTNLYMDLIK